MLNDGPVKVEGIDSLPVIRALAPSAWLRRLSDLKCCYLYSNSKCLSKPQPFFIFIFFIF